MNLKNTIKILTVVTMLSLLGCTAHSNHKHWVTDTAVHEYSRQGPDNTWIYWYVIWANSNTIGSNTYYYTSSTPVTNFSSVPFTKSVNGQTLPEDVQDEINSSTEVSQRILAPTEEPADVREELTHDEADTTDAQQDAMTNEGGPAPAETESAPSSDSGSSSSDSGSSGDSGGSSSE